MKEENEMEGGTSERVRAGGGGRETWKERKTHPDGVRVRQSDDENDGRDEEESVEDGSSDLEARGSC